MHILLALDQYARTCSKEDMLSLPMPIHRGAPGEGENYMRTVILAEVTNGRLCLEYMSHVEDKDLYGDPDADAVTSTDTDTDTDTEETEGQRMMRASTKRMRLECA